MASSPVRSPAAVVNAPSIRRKHRSTSARNSVFLVGKSRNRYGWLIPARRATSSVEVPASPWAANSATAASSTSSRRSAAGIRCLVIVMGTKLVTTHYFVKGGREGFVKEDREGPVKEDTEGSPADLGGRDCSRSRRNDVTTCRL